MKYDDGARGGEKYLRYLTVVAVVVDLGEKRLLTTSLRAAKCARVGGTGYWIIVSLSAVS